MGKTQLWRIHYFVERLRSDTRTHDFDMTQEPPERCLHPICSAAFASKLAALRANVLRYYDLCLVVRQSQEEMQLLNQQYQDIASDAAAEDAVEWILSGQDVPACREWEAAHPGWKTIGNGLRRNKTNSPEIPDTSPNRACLPNTQAQP